MHFFVLSNLEVLIVATVLLPLPPHERPHNRARPEVFRAICPTAVRRGTLNLHVAALEDSAELGDTTVSILEHWESHAKDFVNDLAVIKDII